MILRELVEEDFAQSWGLSRVAFGGERGSTPPAPTIPRRAFGAFDDAGRLLAKVALRDYEQWWGGRAVPMVGMAGVVSLPEVRGQGLVPRLLDLARHRRSVGGWRLALCSRCS